MTKKADYNSLRLPDRVRTPLIIVLPLLFYIAGTAAMIMARQKSWASTTHVMIAAGIFFGLTFLPVAITFAFRVFVFQNRIRTTSDWRIPNEISRYYFEIFKPDIPFAEGRMWFVRTYYCSFVYAAVALLVTVFSWADIF